MVSEAWPLPDLNLGLLTSPTLHPLLHGHRLTVCRELGQGLQEKQVT